MEIGLGVLPQNAAQLALAEDITTWSRHSRRTERRNRSQMGFKLRVPGGMRTISMPVPSATAVNLVPKLVIVVPYEISRALTGRSLPKLLTGPRVAGGAGHIEVRDLPVPMDNEEQGEDGSEEDIVELQEVAGPDLMAAVPEEGASR